MKRIKQTMMALLGAVVIPGDHKYLLMKTKIAIVLALLSYGPQSLFAQGQYKMKFPMPIENMDADKALGYNAFGYYNQNSTDGTFVLQIAYQYEKAYPFNQETGLARIVFEGKFGFIDVTNYPVVKAIYDDAKDYTENGHAMVCLNGKWGLIDSKGFATIPCVYDSMSDMFNGWYEVSKDDEWGYISKMGTYAATYQEYELKRNISEEH